MKTVEAVVSDLDGTIISADGSISPIVCEVVDLLKSRDILLVPVSGRDYHGIDNLLDPLGLQGYGVFSGGASVINLKTKLPVIEHRLPVHTAKEVVGNLIPYSTYIGYGKGHVSSGEIDIDDVNQPVLSVWAMLEDKNIVDAHNQLAQIPGIQSH